MYEILTPQGSLGCFRNILVSFIPGARVQGADDAEITLVVAVALALHHWKMPVLGEGLPRCLGPTEQSLLPLCHFWSMRMWNTQRTAWSNRSHCFCTVPFHKNSFISVTNMKTHATTFLAPAFRAYSFVRYHHAITL